MSTTSFNGTVINRYSDEDLEKFKKIIFNKLEVAQNDLELFYDSLVNQNGTDGQHSLSKEENIKLAARQEKFISDLKNALVRIENKSYGICRVTGKLIAEERLRLVPHATLSMEAKTSQPTQKTNGNGKHVFPEMSRRIDLRS